MKQITIFSIDSSDLTAASSTRDLTILGDAGSRFVLYLSNENPHYYDFSTDTFSATETKLHGEIPSSGKYVKKITFPTITDDDQYDFQLVANPSHEVELAEGLSLGNLVYYRTKILQKADVVLTFAVATTTSGDFQTMPTSVTLTKPPLSTGDEKGVSALKAGLTELTATVNGAVSGANAITLDDAHGIRADGTAKLKGIGFDNRVIQYVTGINYAGKVIEVTGNQTLEDNTILTFSNCAQEAVITAKASAVLTLDLDSILTSSIT